MAAGFRSKCPNCNKTVHFPGTSAKLMGKTIKCPHCGFESKFCVDQDGDFALVGLIKKQRRN